MKEAENVQKKHDLQTIKSNGEGAAPVDGGIGGGNLFFEVVQTANDATKRQYLLKLLAEEKGTALIYTATIKPAEELYRWLASEGINAALYSDKVKGPDREALLRQCLHHEYKAIVAPMGFDLGEGPLDIGLVVHYNFPDSVESYYQGAGRFGRAEASARAVLLCSRLEDRRIQSYSLAEKLPHRDESLRFYDILSEFSEDAEPGEGVPLASLITASGLADRRVKVVAAQLDGAGIIKRKRQRVHKLRDFKDRAELEAFLNDYERRYASHGERLQGMLRYVKTAMCRLRYLRNYFGETVDRNCGHCDNCRRAALQKEAKGPLRRKKSLSSSRSFRKGEMVRHPTFGEGEVMEVEGEKTTVAFVRGGTKKLLSSYLQK